MKRQIAMLLALLMLILAGCAGEEEGNKPGFTLPNITKPTQPAPTETVPTQPAPTETEPTQPPSFFEVNRKPVEGQSNLYYLPSEAVENLDVPEVFLIGDRLILCSFQFDDGFENTNYLVRSLDLMSGTLAGQMDYDCSPYTSVRVKGDNLVFADSVNGIIRVYDSSLKELKTIRHEVDVWMGEDWQLSNDLSRLYILNWTEGMTMVELATGKQTQILSDVTELMFHNWDGDDMIISYVDRATQKECAARYCTLTDQLQQIDKELPGVWFRILDGNILVHDYYREDHYFLGQEDRKVHFYDWDSSVTLLEDNLILVAKRDPHEMLLYKTDGTFLTKCTVGEDTYNDYIIPIWYDALGGYLMVAPVGEADSRLYLWDASAAVEGKNLTMQPYSGDAPGGYTADPELYRRAEEISQKYGVDVRIADQCALDYEEYYGYGVEDTDTLADALDQLEKALGSYPEGFFSQLLYGGIESIRIEFVGGLEKKDLAWDAEYTSFSAFAQERIDHYLMVVDVEYAQADTYYHEISHIIDKRLGYDAGIRGDSMYSETAWMELQPDGFEYSYSYDYLPDDVGSWRYDGWFVDYYSCTYPTEDRARIMEYAMGEYYWPFEGDTPIDDKLAYYSQCIRDCFDTTGWPEKTVWEMAIDQ